MSLVYINLKMWEDKKISSIDFEQLEVNKISHLTSDRDGFLYF